jgi:type IV pilus assembly protein PilM
MNLNTNTDTSIINMSIGLDIGSSYIKAVKLRKDSNQVFLDDFCLKYAGENIQAVLGQVASECNLANKRVNVSLSGKSTIIRNLWLPKLSPKELKVSLGYELDQHIPFPVDDVFFDSYILEENQLTRKEGQMRVVLAAANKRFVLERIQWLKSNGMVANLIDMDAASLFNIYQAELNEGAVVGLIDIGSSKTIINVVSNNVLIFTREVEYGTMGIRDSVAKGLSVEPADAEKLIASGDPKASGWVNDLIVKLSKEIWNSFEYYEGQEQQHVEKVYISGGGSLFPEISSLLEHELGAAVTVWHPLNKIKVNLDEARKTEFEKISPMFSIALGLAYRTL